MRKFFWNLFLVSVPAILLLGLLLELVFRFIIPAADVPDLYYDKAEKMIHYDPDHHTTGVFTLGKLGQQKGSWSINNLGWNSPYDYKDNPEKKKIAIIGDSYVEAMTIDIKNAYPFRLNSLMKDSFDVYAFGMSGAPFSQYLHISRWVVKKFNPDILIFNIVHNDFDESLKEHAAKRYYKLLDITPDSTITEVDPVDDEPSAFEKDIKRSALVRYLWLNLSIKETLQKLFHREKHDPHYNSNIDVDDSMHDLTKIELATDYMFKKLREENPDKRIILIMDGPRTDIYNGNLKNCNAYFLNHITRKYAALHQLEFIDLTATFNKEYHLRRKSFNTGVDYHWNVYGHQLVTDTLYKYLNHNHGTAKRPL